MDKTTFENRLRFAAQKVVEIARLFVQQALSDDLAFLVYPNQSGDGNPRVGDEVVFPNDSLPDEHYHGPWTLDQALDYLWRDGKVPEWIDAAVEGEAGGKTLVGLRCCGRFTAQDELLYHHRGGIPPFSLKSPALPPGWQSVEASGKFDLYWQEKINREGGTRVLLPVALWRIAKSWFIGGR